MPRSADRRLTSAAGTLLFAAVVIGGAVGVLGWQRSAAAERAAPAPHPAVGARTIADLPSVLPAARLPEAVTVGILHDSASDRYFASPAAMDSVLSRWRAALEDVGAVPRVVTPRQALAARDLRALVVPASPCLGREAREAIDAAERRGTGVVLTWLTGVRDGGCRSVGYGLIANGTGAARADTVEASQADAYVTLLGDGPLTLGMPPASRLELLVDNHVALRLPSREGYYSDFTLNPRAAHGAELLDAALATSARGRARVAYWGFDLGRVASSAWNRELVRLLVRNTVAFAAGLPQARVLAWPDGRPAAAAIAQDVEDQFGNARYAMDSLRAAGVRGTYFLVSRLAERNESLARAMAEQGEVGSHSPRHLTFDGVPAEEQRQRFAETQRTLAKLVGHRVAGFRPPQEQFDWATLREWSAAGGGYLFGTNNARTASPEIIDVDGRPLVLFGRVTNDDFISVVKAGDTDARSLADAYATDLEKVRALGGMWILSYHSQLLARPELVPALAMVARRVRADSSLWVTTTGEAARWWLARSAVRLSVDRTADGRVRLTATNDGDSSVRNGVAEVIDGEWRTRVRLPTLAPGATFDTTVVVNDVQ